ncbi:MAG TPA: thioredoxin domain-containing protein [Chitinispirillaceae bacterium]|nr:thioredoxin domain-containing protein [Chitinispirillaceae bacterium]
MKQFVYASACFFVLFIPVLSTEQSSVDTCGKGFLTNEWSDPDSGDLIKMRFEQFRTWLIELNKPCKNVISDLKTRYAMQFDTVQYNIDTSGVYFAGTDSSPVQIIMYISMSCPMCKRLYKEMYDSVTIGNLVGKAKLGIKPYNTNILDRSLAASAHFGKQAEFLIATAPIRQRLSIYIIYQIADSLKIPLEEFKEKIESPQIYRYTQLSRKEAIKNGVTVTPTFFINNRRYRSYKDIRWVADATQWWLGAD